MSFDLFWNQISTMASLLNFIEYFMDFSAVLPVCYHKSIKSLLIFFGVFTCFAQNDLHNLCFKMLSLSSDRVLFKLV